MSLIVLYTFYLFSMGFPLWMLMASMEYEEPSSAGINMLGAAFFCASLFVWTMVFGRRFPEAARSVMIVVAVTLLPVFVWLAFQFVYSI